MFQKKVNMSCKITEDRKAYKKQWYENNIEKKKAYDKQRYLQNKEKILENVKIYNKTNKEQKSLYSKSYRLKNAKKLSEYKKIYYKFYSENNRGFIAQKNRRRKKQLKECQTPLWVDLKKINIIYKQAKRLSIIEGRQYHVDHIIPLNSKIVSGLHVIENLQIILAKDNLIKSNKFTEETKYAQY